MITDAIKTIPKKYAPIAVTLITITTGILGIWAYVKPETELADFSGKWKIVCNVEKSSNKGLIDESMVYEVYVTQKGEEITGKGEQVLYNDKIAPGHFKFEIDDVQLDNRNMKIRYTLDGNGRLTEGLIEVNYEQANPRHLVGVYSGTAANVEGKAEIFIE